MSLLCFLLLEHYLLKAATLLILQDLCCILVLFILLCQLFLLFFQWCLFYDLEIHVPFRGGKKKKEKVKLTYWLMDPLFLLEKQGVRQIHEAQLWILQKSCLCSVQWPAWKNPMGLEKREVQDSWLVFKLKNGPAWSAGNQVKVVGVLYGLFLGEEGTPDKAQTWKLKLLAYTRAEPGDRGIVYRHWACRNGVRKARAHLELNSVRDVKLLKVH